MSQAGLWWILRDVHNHKQNVISWRRIMIAFYFPSWRSNWIIQWMIQVTANSIFGLRQICGDCMRLWTRLPVLNIYLQSWKWSMDMGGSTALEICRKGGTWDSCTVLVLCRRLFFIWVPKCMWILVMGRCCLFENNGCGGHFLNFQKEKFKLHKYPLIQYELMHYDPLYFMFFPHNLQLLKSEHDLTEEISSECVMTVCLISLLPFTIMILMWSSPQL